MSRHRPSNSSAYHQQQQPRQQQPQSYGAPLQSAGGFANYAAPPRPPPGADPKLWNWFVAVDEDRSGAISAAELQRALVNGNWTQFDLDTIKMLLNMFDVDHSGTIGFNEFAGLWKYIEDWQGVFRHFDRDRSGSIDQNELGAALRGFGYTLSPHLVKAIMDKYSSAPTTSYGPPPGVSFDRFVRACVAIKTLTDLFKRADHDNDGWVQLNYDSFMDIFLRAP